MRGAGSSFQANRLWVPTPQKGKSAPCDVSQGEETELYRGVRRWLWRRLPDSFIDAGDGEPEPRPLGIETLCARTVQHCTRTDDHDLQRRLGRSSGSFWCQLQGGSDPMPCRVGTCRCPRASVRKVTGQCESTTTSRASTQGLRRSSRSPGCLGSFRAKNRTVALISPAGENFHEAWQSLECLSRIAALCVAEHRSWTELLDGWPGSLVRSVRYTRWRFCPESLVLILTSQVELRGGSAWLNQQVLLLATPHAPSRR